MPRLFQLQAIFTYPSARVQGCDTDLLTFQNDVGPQARVIIPHGGSYEEMLAHGGVIAGSPATVRAALEKLAAELGINYLLTYMFLGTMSLADALRSLELFRTEVMPHLEKL